MVIPQRQPILSSIGFMLVGLGLISLGIAIAPLAPAAQWHVGQVISAVTSFPKKFVKIHDVPATIIINHLPANADRPFTEAAKIQTLEELGKASVAIAALSRQKNTAPTPAANAKIGAQPPAQPNSLTIKSIGINMAIVEGKNSTIALNKGGWRITETSTPDKGGNTVIACHRYLYTKGPNVGKNCYHLDKVAVGNIIEVYWKGKTYTYRVREKKIVKPTDISILDATAAPIITILTCNPVYSTKERLIVVGELVNVN